MCWLSYWLIGWLTNWLTGCHVNWLIDGLAYQHSGQLACWLAQLLTGCFTDKLIDWQSLIDWSWLLAHWLLTWLAGWYTEIHGKKRIKITYCESRLLIANEDGQFFISDEMWPADVLRLQQPGFWAYPQYCKCCIHCIVIYNPGQNCWGNIPSIF